MYSKHVGNSKLMKNLFLKKTFSFTMILAFFAQTVGVVAPSHYAVGAEQAKSFPDAAYIKTWNEVASKWESIKSGADLDRAAKKLKVGYNQRFYDQDKKFWLSYMIQSTTLAHLTQNGDSFEFWSNDKKQKLLSFKVDGNKYIFENGEFVYNDSESLEKNFARLKSIVLTTKVSLLESIFIPRAHADGSIWWAIGGAILAFVVVRGFQTNWGNFREARSEHMKARHDLKEGDFGDATKHLINVPGKLLMGDGKNDK